MQIKKNVDIQEVKQEIRKIKVVLLMMMELKTTKIPENKLEQVKDMDALLI